MWLNFDESLKTCYRARLTSKSYPGLTVTAFRKKPAPGGNQWGRCNGKVLARNAKLHRLRRRGLLPSLTKTEQRALLARLLPNKA